jgi:hypothetical protein
MTPTWFRTLLLLSARQAVESAHLDRARQAGIPACKAVPGSGDWPSPDTWKALNESIGGRLLQPTPLGAVCHPGHASYSAAQCPVVQAAWFTEPLHSEDPVSAYWNNWTRDTCLPDPRAPCSSDGYPVYVVNATTAEHVKAGVDFGLLMLPSRRRWVALTGLSKTSPEEQHQVNSQEQRPRLSGPFECPQLPVHMGAPHERYQGAPRWLLSDKLQRCH